MRLTDFPVSATAAPVERNVTPQDRARLSGPALRTFRAIGAEWELSEAQRIAALGHPGRSTYHSWMKKAAAGTPVTLPHDTLIRISALLGIYKALAILFLDRKQGLDWLANSHRGSVFAGASPLSLMVDNGIDGMMIVRRYLDAWRGGQVGHGAPEGSFEPVTENDLVFM